MRVLDLAIEEICNSLIHATEEVDGSPHAKMYRDVANDAVASVGHYGQGIHQFAV